MIRAHLRRFIGGDRGGPLRSLPQESVARAKPALEAEPSSLGGVICDEIRAASSRLPHESVPLSSAGFAGATTPGGRFRKGGDAPLRVERTESTPRAASPSSPRIWALLSGLSSPQRPEAAEKGPAGSLLDSPPGRA